MIEKLEIGNKIKLTIVDLNHEGFGVGKIDNFTIFIKGALIGEEVIVEITRIEKSYGYAKLLEITSSSPNREKPRCHLFGICGGCELMHLKYEEQLKFKVKMAKETLLRLGHLDLEIEDIIGMNDPYYYRNKVQIPFSYKNEKTICGYYKKKTHDIINYDKCYLAPSYFDDCINFIRNLCNEYKIEGYNENTKQGILRHILLRHNYLDEIMIVFVTNKDIIPYEEKIIEKIVKRYKVKSIIQNINKNNTNTILGTISKTLYGDNYLIDDINGLKFYISHDAFFQINHKQVLKLYNNVIEFLSPTKEDIIIDGYCGVGTISLMLANKAKKVIGIEIVNDAIINANNNAKLNNINNVSFIVGKVEEKIYDYLDEATSLVLDPPRKGIDREVLNKIMETNIKKIVYVSCNIATLARDLEILNSKYEIKRIKLVDMFCHVADVETVVQLASKTYQG